MSDPANRHLKVGVTGDRKSLDADSPNRVDQHEEHGWVMVQQWSFAVGADALTVEDAVIDWWRGALLLEQSLLREQMPQGGASETCRDSPANRAATVDFIASEVARLHS